MMQALNLKRPKEFPKSDFKKLKENEDLIRYYQIHISVRQYLRKYRLFDENTRNADAVVFFSSSIKAGWGLI